ncbi:MAG: glycosyltransferase [Pseudomonadota bacterium]
MSDQKTIGVVIIGRNEGDRLLRCLASVENQVDHVVYVDSGSSDGSQDAALATGAHVVALDMSKPFTAARARNEGLARLLQERAATDYVQFIDGDCELQPDWISKARSFLNENPDHAVVCGRRRERFPEASVYNRLIDQEWDTPTGSAKACGGDALMRVEAFQQVEGFDPNLIAGEEPELCVRLRQSGWLIWRLDAEMTLHDAALSKFSQWWKRNKRAGHAYAEGAALHGAPPERHGVHATRSALFWGLGIPALALLGSFVSSWALLLFLAWPAQMLRLGLRSNDWAQAMFLTLGKLPEAQGAVGYLWDRLRGKRGGLIEYK